MKPKILFYILSVLLVIIVGCGAAGIYYLRTVVARETTALRETQAAIIVNNEHVDQLQQLKKQYLALLPKFASLELALPRAKKQSEIVLQLQKLASDVGMSIPNISFNSISGNGLPSSTSQTVTAGDAVALPISFQTQGTYDQFQRFLTSLETLNRYTNVTSIGIARTKTGNTYTIQLNVFIKP